jgi:hypothetical protein
MKRAIRFFTIALGTAAVAFPLVSKCISASPTPSPPAANGLECHVEEYMSEFNSLNGKTTSSTTSSVDRIEFLPDNRFRGVDDYAKNDVMANDYIGTMTTTDTTYSFCGLKDCGQVPSFVAFTVDRLTTRLEGRFHGSSLTILKSGWCAPGYIPPRSTPKKL